MLCRFLDSFIISHFEVFVKSFSKVFKNFFVTAVFLKSDLIIIPQLFEFVKPFFNFNFSAVNHLFSRRLIHYITFRKICQVFFKTFFSQTSVNLFSVVQNSSSVLSSDSFIIISSFFVKVK